MPFRSEKQRRFLWAAHPDIAKRWAKKYPESNKDLPMYAENKSDKDTSNSKAAAVQLLRSALVNNSDLHMGASLLPLCANYLKRANSKLEHIEMPHDEKPTYAGEKEINSILKPDTEDEGSIGQEKSVQGPEKAVPTCSNPLLSKLAVVLSPKLQQELENIKAEEEARKARRVPDNVNVKQYPVANNMVPPPMGMTAPPPVTPEPQAPAPEQLAAVGGGNSPNANPINSFGGLSTDGDINGNAAFGTQNSMGGEKLAGVRDAALLSLPLVTGALGAYMGGRRGHNNWLRNEDRNDPGGVTSAMNGALVGGLGGVGLGVIPALIDKYELRNGTITPRQSYLKRWKGYSGLDHLIKDDNAEEKASAQKCSCGCGDTTVTCKCPPKCSCRQKGGSCYGLELKKQASTPKLRQLVQNQPTQKNIYQYLQNWSLRHHKQPDYALDSWEDLEDDLGRAYDPARFNDVTERSALVGELAAPLRQSYADKKQLRAAIQKYMAENMRFQQPVKQAGGNNDILAQITGISSAVYSDPADIMELDDEMYSKHPEKVAAIGLWDRIRAKKKRGEKPAKPGDKDYPDAKSWDKVTAISEKKADNSLYTPSEDVLTRAFENFRATYTGDAAATANKIDSARFHVAGGTYNDPARPNADKLSPALPYVIDAVYRAGQEKGDPTLRKNFNGLQHELKLTRTEADQIQKNLYDKINNLSAWTTNPRLWAGVGIGAGGVLGAYGLKKLYDRHRRPKPDAKSWDKVTAISEKKSAVVAAAPHTTHERKKGDKKMISTAFSLGRKIAADIMTRVDGGYVPQSAVAAYKAGDESKFMSVQDVAAGKHLKTNTPALSSTSIGNSTNPPPGSYTGKVRLPVNPNDSMRAYMAHAANFAAGNPVQPAQVGEKQTILAPPTGPAPNPALAVADKIISPSDRNRAGYHVQSVAKDFNENSGQVGRNFIRDMATPGKFVPNPAQPGGFINSKYAPVLSGTTKGGAALDVIRKSAGASSPAWQRSAGKNEEGGLNEKGRKSYEREHGGNLKAPVTESNPSGERAKRQNSFCSRMCGMKRVNTGASTAKDPDSRINKSLRKWNCKCSSAFEFGSKIASSFVSGKDNR